MHLESLGAIGNCQASALISTAGAVEWLCLPRVDSPPVFGRLLDPDGGHFCIRGLDDRAGEQRYIDNTNVLQTTFASTEGTFRVTDFLPRFTQYDRMNRPTQLWRMIEPLSGAPMMRIDCKPVLGWTKTPAPTHRGSNHVSFDGYGQQLRLTTDVPIEFLDGRPLPLLRPQVLALTWGSPIEEPLQTAGNRLLYETVRYWQKWVKHCSIPALFQKEVIRSALALKLCCHEDTGAIVAALTTSIPEAPGQGRTWDYRYCWLRDSYYTLDALRLLGHFEERAAFTEYLLMITANEGPLNLKPLYAVDGKLPPTEVHQDNWAGYEGHGPVRVGNEAQFQQQHDIYGEVVQALLPMYLDERFAPERGEAVFRLLERLATEAARVGGTPDAGIWEPRTAPRVETFSSLMCWTAMDRVSKISQSLKRPSAEPLRAAAEALHARILAEAWHEKTGAFASSFGGTMLDASLLQMPRLRFLPKEDPRLKATVDTIARTLDHKGWLLRYLSDDGFGVPTVAFTLCTFWLVEALAATQRLDAARDLLARLAKVASPVGLYSEDFDPVNVRLWGNFPQAYSHVGLIHAAFAASPTWAEVM